jgi:hypothetical protein
MTLILAHLSKFGIIHASDSNLTSNANTSAGQGQKTFKLPFLNAGLTIAGAYSVAGKSMDVWMTDFVSAQASGGVASLSQFAEALRKRLEAEMDSDEKNSGSMAHIAGYVEKDGFQHPEFYFVRNVYGISESNGEYFDVRNQFAVSEDFWNRDCPKSNAMAAFQSGAYQLYINGFASGRVGYFMLQERMNSFFRAIWEQSQWKFRPPQSLAETVLFVKLYMNVVETLFQVSDYSAPFIGGGCQIHEIPQPTNTVTRC